MKSDKNSMETKHKTGTDLVVNINNTIFRYDDMGNGSVPVIFIHGFPFDKQMWLPQVQYLSKSIRVIAYDIRGFGKSESGAQMPSIGLFAEDLINFMDALEIERAVVCGFSMGGYITLKALNIWPERFEAVILFNTQCMAATAEAKDSYKRQITQILAGNREDFIDDLVSKMFHKDSLVKKKKIIQKVKDIVLSTHHYTITGTLSELANREETCNTLEKIAVPVLILSGENDQVVSPQQSEYLFNNIAQSKWQVINGTGHLSNLEHPEEFNKQILQFVAGLRE